MSTWSTWCPGAGARRWSASPAPTRTWLTTAPAASCAAAVSVSAGKSCPSAAGAISTGATTAKWTRPTACPWSKWAVSPAASASAPARWGLSPDSGAPQGARAWQTTKIATTCSYCADGCRLLVHSFRDRVVRVSSEEQKGLNGGNLCVKGRFALGYADAADRLTAPQVAQAGGGLDGSHLGRGAQDRGRQDRCRAPRARGPGCGGRLRDQLHERDRLSGAEADADRAWVRTTSIPSTMPTWRRPRRPWLRPSAWTR